MTNLLDIVQLFGGAGGIGVAVYMLLRSEITIRYPRRPK
jgi:hypothetical protein